MNTSCQVGIPIFSGISMNFPSLSINPIWKKWIIQTLLLRRKKKSKGAERAVWYFLTVWNLSGSSFSLVNRNICSKEDRMKVKQSHRFVIWQWEIPDPMKIQMAYRCLTINKKKFNSEFSHFPGKFGAIFSVAKQQ